MSEDERQADQDLRDAKAKQLAEMSEPELLAELVKARPYIPPEEIEAEVKVRQVRVTKELTASLVAFKASSETASGRLETLTKWLIGFTVVLVVLTVAVVVLTAVVAVHDFTQRP